MHRRARYRATLSVLVLCSVAAGISMAEAAQVTWADPFGSCNGETPCFSTLGAAVANAGPAPAEVFVFPGFYAESVDLSTMGSAVGEAAGDLAVVAVDSSGQPAPGALVDPAALGGPGTGSALHAASFPGALTIDGLILRSPDASALQVDASGNVVVSSVDASDAAVGGVKVLSSGDIRLEGSTAMRNGETGFVLLTTGGDAEVVDCQAQENGLDGVVVLGLESTVAEDVVASDNGRRGVALAGDRIVAQRVTAESNAEEGLALAPREGGSYTLTEVTANRNRRGVAQIEQGLAASGVLSEIVVRSNLEQGIGLGAESLTASGLTAADNGGNGAVLFALGPLDVADVTSSGNADAGLLLVSSEDAELRLLGCEVTANLAGVVLRAGAVVLEDCSALGNGPVQGGQFDGVGFAIAADRLDASDNRALDNQTGWLFVDELTVAPEVARVAGEDMDRRHLARWAASSKPRNVDSAGAQSPQQLTLLATQTEGNADAAMRVTLREQGRLVVACSDFIANGPAGLELLSDETVDAFGNYWGSPTGPTHPTNPVGTGDIIRDSSAGASGAVRFAPFLTVPAASEDCPVPSVVEVPTLASYSLALLAVLVAGAALALLRARSGGSATRSGLSPTSNPQGREGTV